MAKELRAILPCRGHFPGPLRARPRGRPGLHTAPPRRPVVLRHKAAEELLAADLERDHPVGEKGFTEAGVRKMIAKINEELAVFESREEARLATPR